MRKVHFDRRSWDAAIREVQQHILEFPGHVPVTTEQDSTLGAVLMLCEQLKAKRRLWREPTNGELARKYRVSPRTVTNWRREGCPFERGQRRVLRWLGRRRYAPAGARTKFARQLCSARLRESMDGLKAMVAEVRELKLEHKLQGIELPPGDWLRGFRCPRR